MAVTMCSYINKTYTSLRHVDASSRFRFRVHFSLLFVNATSQFCDILASRRSAVDYIDVKNLRKWLIPVSAVATACCGRAFQFIIVRGIKLNLKIFVRV